VGNGNALESWKLSAAGPGWNLKAGNYQLMLFFRSFKNVFVELTHSSH
jgi:hypothetical protein